MPKCDHKFIDSPHCLKCGWSPRGDMTIRQERGDWFYTDCYGQVWRLAPTMDPVVPLTISREEG